MSTKFFIRLHQQWISLETKNYKSDKKLIYLDGRGGPLQITLTGLFYHCYHSWTLVGVHRLVDHMIVNGASSLRRTLDYLPYDLKVKYRRFNFAKSGLILNPTNVSKFKKLQWLLRKGSLKSRETILWHDVINNCITKHPKNFNTKCSPEQLTEIITNFQHQICDHIHSSRQYRSHLWKNTEDETSHHRRDKTTCS